MSPSLSALEPSRVGGLAADCQFFEPPHAGGAHLGASTDGSILWMVEHINTLGISHLGPFGSYFRTTAIQSAIFDVILLSIFNDWHVYQFFIFFPLIISISRLYQYVAFQRSLQPVSPTHRCGVASTLSFMQHCSNRKY